MTKNTASASLSGASATKIKNSFATSHLGRVSRRGLLDGRQVSVSRLRRRRLQHRAAAGQVPDPAVAPQHRRGGRRLPEHPPAELDRRHGLGADATLERRHLGPVVTLHRPAQFRRPSQH
jgi:hypothetical protein